MTNVFCGIKNCYYNGGTFCKRQSIKLDDNCGRCDIVFRPDGSIKDYPYWERSAMEQRFREFAEETKKEEIEDVNSGN